MSEVETVYIRGENGVVKPHDLPLPWAIEDRLAKGQVHQVDGPDDPSALTLPEKSVLAGPGAEKEPERVPLTRPAVNDPKDAWAAWAMQVDPDLTEDDVKATTKAQLIERY